MKSNDAFFTKDLKAFDSLQMNDVARVNVPVDADASAKRLSKAITFPTISNQDRKDFDERAFHGFHHYLIDTYPNVHKTMKREVLGYPRVFSLLYTWAGKNPILAPIVLMAHQDVVPVVPGTEKNWDYDPFSGDIMEGYIWGRGSLDDKIMIMAILEAAENLIKQGFQPTRTTYFAFGQDEEVGGTEGIKYIVPVLKSRGVNEIALVLDEGLPLTTGLFPGIKHPIALIGTAEKGYLSLELNVEGPGGHSAMPPKNTHIGILAQAITKLEANPFPSRITQAVRDQFRFLGPELPPQYRRMLADVVLGCNIAAASVAATSNELPGNSESSVAKWIADGNSEDQLIKVLLDDPRTAAMVHTTTAVTMFNAGIKDNVLPPSASAVVNFRILQEETVQSVINHVKAIINDSRVKVNDISASIDPSPIADPYGMEYRLLEKTIRQTWGTPELIVSPYLMIGGADAKYFSKITKNVYRFTAVRVESADDTMRWHGVNERVLVSEYAKSIGFFEQLIRNAENL
jgi:carboxypeptidase PM20D1